MMELYLPIDPADIPSAQQKGVMVRYGRVMFYEKSNVTKARNALINALKNCSNGETINCLPAYSCLIVYVYKPKTLKRKDFGKPKTTRPDVDNITKLVLDAITDSHIAWMDDGQVTTLAMRKRYAEDDEAPFVYINIDADKVFNFENNTASYSTDADEIGSGQLLLNFN
jgi:Holliday junction resolvase RusA-like endonuclease